VSFSTAARTSRRGCTVVLRVSRIIEARYVAICLKWPYSATNRGHFVTHAFLRSDTGRRCARERGRVAGR
jgi:hypothetical protein